MSQPNVVLVCMDCARYDFFPQLPHCRTPQNFIPKLSGWFNTNKAQAIEARSQASGTPPSIASMFTGLYPSETGINSKDVRPDQYSLIPRLSYNKYGVSTNPLIIKDRGYSEGFDKWVDLLHEQKNGVLTTIKDFKMKEPFFLYAHYMDIHTPPSRDHVSEIPLERYKHISHPYRRKIWRDYSSGIWTLDDKLFSLVNYINKVSSKPTVFIFFADHGELLMDEKWLYYGHAVGVRELLTRVPLIIVGSTIKYSNYLELRQVIPYIMNSCNSNIDYGTDTAISMMVSNKPCVKKALRNTTWGQWVSVTKKDQKYIHETLQTTDGKVVNEYYYNLKVDIEESRNTIEQETEQLQSQKQVVLEHINQLQSHKHIREMSGFIEIETSLDNKVLERLKHFGYIE